MRKLKNYEKFVNEEVSLKKLATTAAIGAGLSFANPAIGQITTTNFSRDTVKTVNQPEKNINYDSLSNWVYDVNELVGQTLYVIPIKKGEPSNLYTKFSIDPPNYSVRPGGSVRLTDAIKTSIPSMNDVYGKYFKILEVIDNGGQSGYEILKLENVESKQILYYREISAWAVGRFHHADEIILLGYYEKLKQLFIGKEFFVFSMDDDGRPGKITKWKCVDISIIETDYNFRLGAVLEYNGHKIPISLYDLKDENKTVMSLNRYKELVNKFGEENLKKMVFDIVEIGMSKEMCLFVLGRPKSIEKTRTVDGIIEQWNYESIAKSNIKYLQFKDGILNLINEFK